MYMQHPANQVNVSRKELLRAPDSCKFFETLFMFISFIY